MVSVSGSLLRPDDVTAYLNIGKSSLYAWARAGRIPGAVRVGHSWRFDADALVAWVNDKKAPANKSA